MILKSDELPQDNYVVHWIEFDFEDTELKPHNIYYLILKGTKGDHDNCYHWLFDDNITNFAKWVNGKRVKIISINDALLYVEQNANKTNVDISGFEEPNFVVRVPKKPFKYNCHVYSAMLIKNNIPYRWRLKYNEDIDLCLQVLHNGGNTSSCVYYMADKVSTANKMKGGN
jgi:hypothetical protein